MRAAPACGDAWFHEPRQERSQATLDALLRALEELLEERDFDDIGVADIAERAGRTVGSFYGRFDDKDAALYALHARHLDESGQFIRELFDPGRFESTALAEVVRNMVAVLVGAYLRPRPSFRVVVLKSATAPAFLAQCADTAAAVGAAWGAVLADHDGEIDHPDPARAAEIGFQVVLAVLNQRLLFGSLVPPHDSTEAELVDDLSDTVLRLLGTRVPAAVG